MKPTTLQIRLMAWCSAAVIAVLCASTTAKAGLGTGAPSEPIPQPHFFEQNGFALEPEAFPLRVVTVGNAPGEISVDAWDALLEASVATWSRVPCSYAELQFAGHRQSRDELSAGEIPIVASEPGCVPDDLAAFTTFTSCAGFPARTIFLNTDEFEWSIEPRPFQQRDEEGHPRILDLESAMTHELGHVLGLSHPDDPFATMYASYRADGSMRTLALDDKLGVCTLYQAGDPMPECSDQRPCPEPQTCVEAGEFTLCEEFRGTVGDQCGLDRLVCESRCALAEGETGYCTAPCESEDDCPAAFECVDGFLGEDAGAYCAEFDSEEPPRGCCSTGVAERPAHSDRVLLLLLGLAVVLVRRRTTS